MRWWQRRLCQRGQRRYGRAIPFLRLPMAGDPRGHPFSRWHCKHWASLSMRSAVRKANVNEKRADQSHNHHARLATITYVSLAA